MSAASLAGLRPPRVSGLDFTAVDFETANGFRGSPCAIGLVRVRDGNVDEIYFRRMRPPAGFDRFDPKNVLIHGITEDRVASEARFGDLFAEIMEFIGSDTLVAHNAAFDVEVFQSALEVSAMDSPGLSCHCSVRLARAVYQLDSHALPKAAAEAGFHLKHHHHALWDARAAAAIVVDIAERKRASSLEELFSAHQLPAEELEPWSGRRRYESRATRQVRAYGPIFDVRTPGIDPQQLPDLMRWQDEGRNMPAAPDADPDHELFGHHVVFTGTLGVPRTQAKELAALHGATTSSRVNGSTTLLVIGDGFEAEHLHSSVVPPPLTARKVRDAAARVEKGQQIQMITEQDFRAMLGSAWPMQEAGAPSFTSDQ